MDSSSTLSSTGEHTGVATEVQHKNKMYVCRKVKNSQARTGHQRGMDGRETDDDDTHEQVRLGRKVKNSQARTGHQRGMDGRETDDDDTPSDTQTQSSALHLFPAKAKRGVWWQASPSFWECSLLVLALVLAHETERKKRCDHFAMV